MKTHTIIKIRKIVAALTLISFILIFCWGSLPGLEKLPKFQIGPAILAGSITVIIIQVAVTLLFGRIYCSLLCPLGIMQEGIASLNKKKLRHGIHHIRWLRLAILGIFAASLVSGYLFIFNTLDPYSTFGRIASGIFAPLFSVINNFCASILDYLNLPVLINHKDSFYGWPILLAAILAFNLLLGLVLKYGRVWCNYCPVGTLLGLISQKSFFKTRLDPQNCVSCGLCQRACEIGCINLSQKHIDASRCVNCLNCIEACPKKAIAYTAPQKSESQPRTIFAASRRGFLSAILPGIILTGGAPMKAEGKETETSIQASAGERISPNRETPIVPPGSRSLDHFSKHCIGCQLCVNICPNNILSSLSYGSGLLQPTLDFKKGYCRPNCNKCAQVCPAGAIDEISLTEKKRLRIGLASINREYCIINRDGVECTACHRVCPQKAISLEAGAERQPAQPSVDKEKCTGCGACEYVCPARPTSAITVNGFKVHEVDTAKLG